MIKKNEQYKYNNVKNLYITLPAVIGPRLFGVISITVTNMPSQDLHILECEKDNLGFLFYYVQEKKLSPGLVCYNFL